MLYALDGYVFMVGFFFFFPSNENNESNALPPSTGNMPNHYSQTLQQFLAIHDKLLLPFDLIICNN